jgi:hypothetical protein
MVKKFTLTAVALAVAACLGAGSASAATMYTSATHKTAVAVGSTFTASSAPGQGIGEYNMVWYGVDGETVLMVCKSGNYQFKVTQNSGGVFKANVVGGTWKECFTPEGSLQPINTGYFQVSGSSVANGSNTAWLGTTAKELTFTAGFQGWDANFSSATGSPPSKGLYTQQPTAAQAPVSFIFNKASYWHSGGGEVDLWSAVFTLSGTAGSWSLG